MDAVQKSKWTALSLRIFVSLDVALLVYCAVRVAQTPLRGLAIAGLVVTSALLLLSMLHMRRRRSKELELMAVGAAQVAVKGARRKHLESSSEERVLKELESQLPRRFTLEELQAATEGFSRKLGHGGFGSVYDGTLTDGSRAAIKRLERQADARFDKQFYAEVATISRIHHVNLLSLLGFCAEDNERLLVYEFMDNSSLDRWLFPKREEAQDDVAPCGSPGPHVSPLDWPVRFRIALETARGLAYLHEECKEKILHLDVKPENILLDRRFHAKVADFGLSRSVGRDAPNSLIVTTLRGTPGYLAPEWLRGFGVDSKADVYGFGMVALELVSGRRAVDKSADSENWHLPTLAFKKFGEGLPHDIFAPCLQNQLNPLASEQAILVIKVALWCIQENPSLRPSMSNVVQMLEGNLPITNTPSSLYNEVPITINESLAFSSISIDSQSSTMP